MELPAITDRNQLPDIFNKLNYTGIGVEVGVQFGYYSSILRKWNGGTIYLIDPWEGHDDHYNLVKNKFANQDFKILREYSPSVATQFSENSIDWVYIDALHDYQSASNDIYAWYSKIRRNGILSGHDYLEGLARGRRFGVKKAVDDFTRKYKLKLYVEKSENRFATWYLMKP